MFKRIHLHIAIVGLVALATSCSKGDNSQKQAGFPKDAGTQPALNESSKYTKKETESSFGRFELYNITNEYLKTRHTEIAAKKLRPLNLQSEFGIDAYHIEGYEIPRTVLIAPKIMLRSSIKGTRPSIRQIDADTIELETQIALFDGTESNIASGVGAKIFSESLKFQSPNRLLQVLTDILGGPPRFLGSLPCPDSIVIADKNQGNFDIKIKTPMKSCPTNVFIPATVNFKKDEYEKFRDGFVRSGQSSVTAKFSLLTPITLSYGKFSIKPKSIYEELKKSKIEEASPITADTLEAALSKTIEAIQKSVDQCIPQEPFAPLKDQIINAFFDTKTQPDCPDFQPICYFLRKRPTDGSLLTLSIKREEFFGDKVDYESTSVLSDSLSERSPLLIRSESQDLLSPPKTQTINNALRTVAMGDIIEFSILKMRQSVYDFKNPLVQNITNPVCTAPFVNCIAGNWTCTNPNTEDYNCRQECTGGWDRICMRGMGCMGGCLEWGQKCRSYSRICDKRRVCDTLKTPDLPTFPFIESNVPAWPNFSFTCTQKSGPQCNPADIQDQWQRITKFSNPFPLSELQPKITTYDDLKTALEGITFQFSNGVICDADSLKPEIISGTKFIIEFKNTDKCKPYDADTSRPYHAPNLNVLSSVTFPTEFKCGELWENWVGDRSYTCNLPTGEALKLETTVKQDSINIQSGKRIGLYVPYYPRTEIEAQLRYVGGYFEAAPEGLKQ